MEMKEKTKKKRQAIMDAALSVFLENGYEKSKIIDIAQKAGVGKGTVYEYFDSKESLFHNLLDTYCQYYKETVGETLAGMESCSARQKLLAIMSIEHDLQQRVGLKAMGPMQFHMEFAHFPGLKQAMLDLLQFKFHTLRHILEVGIHTGELRQINTSLGAVILMSSCGVALDLMEYRPSESCNEAMPCPAQLVPPSAVEGFTDENLLDLIMQGFCSPCKKE